MDDIIYVVQCICLADIEMHANLGIPMIFYIGNDEIAFDTAVDFAKNVALNEFSAVITTEYNKTTHQAVINTYVLEQYHAE